MHQNLVDFYYNNYHTSNMSANIFFHAYIQTLSIFCPKRSVERFCGKLYTNRKQKQENSMRVLGQHILVELYGCNSNILNNVDLITKFMEEAAEKSNATIVNSAFHHFSPHGVSGVVVISESHLAIHTWPEHNYAAVDLFTCGSGVEPLKAFEVLKSRFKATHFVTREIKRGLPDPGEQSGSRIQNKQQQILQQIETPKNLKEQLI